LLQFAVKLKHPVERKLRFANVFYTADDVPNSALKHYSTLKEMFSVLKGFALFDYLPNLMPNPKLNIQCWKRRELENYFAKPDLLKKWARLQVIKQPTYKADRLETAMAEAIVAFTPPAYLRDINNPWWETEKLTDNWIDKILPEFYKSIGLPQSFYKRDYYELIMIMDAEDIPNEINEKLDMLLSVLE